MEPLIIDTSNDEQAREETIWWTCQGVIARTCDFPLSMPPEVFWTTRNGEQIESDVVPLPNFHLLPAKFHHLYSGFFNPTRSADRTMTTPLPVHCLKRKSEQTSFPLRPSKLICEKSTKREPKKSLAKQKELDKDSLDQSLKLIDHHVRYVPDVGSISARIGKEVLQKPVESSSASMEWTDLRLAACDSLPNSQNMQGSDQFIENLPSCSSASSSNSLGPNVRQLSEDHSFNIPPLGDSELDKLVKENLIGLLRTKKMKKRKKKSKVKPVEEVSQNFDDTLPAPYTYEPADDDFGLYEALMY